MEKVGNYIYMGHWGNPHSDKISIYDNSVAGTATFVSEENHSAISVGSILDIESDGTYLYTCSRYTEKVMVIDYSNPVDLNMIGSVSTGPSSIPSSIKVVGNYLYVTDSQFGGVKVIDISVPTAPVVVHTVGGMGISTSKVDVDASGNFLYVASSNGLQVVDISTPTTAFIQATIIDALNYYRCFVNGSYLYAAQGANLYTYDISTPSNPVLQGVPVTLTNGIYSFDGDASYLYAGTYATGTTGAVTLLDISAPNSPVIIDEYPADNHRGHDVFANAGFVYSLDEIWGDELCINGVQPLCSDSTSSFSVSEICSYTVPSGDETYFIDGVYMDTIPNSTGCDSIMTITVTLLPVSVDPLGDQTLVCGDTYQFVPNVPGGVLGTGGTISTDGNYTIHTFTGDGTFNINSNVTAEVLVVGGGGGGGGGNGSTGAHFSGGGGGAGGLIYDAAFAVSSGSHPITIGLGGIGAPVGDGTDGTNSIFSTLTAFGGGGGGQYAANGHAGGSGGGAGRDGGTFGSGAPGQGFQGANQGGGGGGAGEPGDTDGVGDGGDGIQLSITGSPVFYAGGGGGSRIGGCNTNPGGDGGGGNGNANVVSCANPAGINAAPNTGGGGGGSGNAKTAGNGADGVVIIRYEGVGQAWSSDNPAVATVDGTGLVTTVGPGTATITFTATIGTCDSTVTAIITVNSLSDMNVSALDTMACLGESVQIDLDSSEIGIPYVLRDDLDDSVVDGPILGTGGPISFNSGAISGTTTYNVYADNGGSCQLEMTNLITITALNLPTITVDSTNMTTCFGDIDGQGFITVSGTPGPYTYDWDHDGIGDNDDVEDQAGLMAGTYNVMVTDSMGCVNSETVIIAEPADLFINWDGSTPPTACGAADGLIEITVTGGTGPYTYDWDNDGTGDFDDSEDLTASAGVYAVEVVDANGCSNSEITGLWDALAPTVNIDGVTDNLCWYDSLGVIDISLTGGTAPFTYLWSDGQTIEDAINLPSGFYTVEVTDAAGCIGVWGDNVNDPGEIIVDATLTEAICFADSNGTAVLSISGGTPGYSEDWGTANPSMLPAGYSSYTITDANNCILMDSVMIIEPAIVSATDSIVQMTCFGMNDGEIYVTGAGGTGPYLIVFEGTDTTDFWTGLDNGTYSYTIEDANGCKADSSATIVEPLPLSFNLIVTDEFAGDDGEIDLTVNGGTAPYSYDWDNDGTGDFDDTEDLAGLSDGDYWVVFQDANGCLDSAMATIANSQLSVNEIETLVNIYPNPNNGQFIIDLGAIQNVSMITVVDAAGRSVYENTTITANQIEMNLQNIEDGLYMITITTENNQIVNRFVKK